MKSKNWREVGTPNKHTRKTAAGHAQSLKVPSGTLPCPASLSWTETDRDRDKDRDRDRDRDRDLSEHKSTRAKMVNKRAGEQSGTHCLRSGAKNRNGSSTSIRLEKRPHVVEVLKNDPLNPCKEFPSQGSV